MLATSDTEVHPRRNRFCRSMPAEFRLTGKPAAAARLKSLQPNRSRSMPTSLPQTYSTAIVAPAKSSHPPDAVWLALIWAAAMLLSGAFADVGPGAAAMEPFQLLATF
jgi:hypothetical protein